MNSFTLGRYIPLDSLMHRFDPRAKIVAMFLLMIAIFIPSGFVGYIGIFFIICIGIYASKLNLKFFWNAMKPMFFMLGVLLVINVLVVKSGEPLITIAGFTIYWNALSQTGYIAVRLILMIVITTLLTATTKPTDLTIALEDLMKPLKKIGFPANEIAMIISIALRFIPTLIEETQRIIKAQTSRGVDLQEGKLKEKVMAILSLIVPLFVSSYQRAEELANAMEARGYVPSRTRTRYRQLQMAGRDFVMLAVCMLVLLSTIGIMIWL